VHRGGDLRQHDQGRRWERTVGSAERQLGDEHGPCRQYHHRLGHVIAARWLLVPARKRAPPSPKVAITAPRDEPFTVDVRALPIAFQPELIRNSHEFRYSRG